MLINLFCKKISGVNSQLSKEINFEDILLMEQFDWSVGQCLQTSSDLLITSFTYGF